MNRRKFLQGTGRSLLAASIPVLPGAKAWAELLPKLPDNAAGLSRKQWQTLAVLQDHLLPSESQAPGAREVNASAYLYYSLTAPGTKQTDRDFIREGLERLDKVLQGMGLGAFPSLDEASREAALRRLEQDKDGQHWIAEVLNFLLESLLVDPLYGGNPGSIGWRWLAHTPGFPRPPKGKEWYKL